jgi:hypothetical protein
MIPNGYYWIKKADFWHSDPRELEIALIEFEDDRVWLTGMDEPLGVAEVSVLSDRLEPPSGLVERN